MKKKILLLLFLVFSHFAFSQKLLDTGKVWNIMECMYPGACLTNTWQLANGDTLVDNHTYKIIEQTDSLWGLYHSDMVFMREDSAKRVYCMTNWGEVMLYDFNLQIGDTFRFGNSFFSQYAFVVDNVDSITLMNGEKRKHISLSGGYEEWIEGIGSTHGLFDAFMEVFILDMGSSLLCFTENGTQKYQDANYQNCFYSSVGIQENKREFTIQISPNPITNKSFISFTINQTQNLKINLFDIAGRHTQTIACTQFKEGENKMEWNASNLNSGIYFLKIQGENFSKTQKVNVMK